MEKIESAHSKSVLSLRFNDNYLVTGSKDTSIKVWDRKSLNLIKTLDGHSAAVNSIHLTDKHIVSGSGDGKINIWDLVTGQRLRTIIGHQRGVSCVQLTADGTKIVSGSKDTTIRIFDISGAENACLTGHSSMVRTVQVNLAGDALPESSEEHRSKLDTKANQSPYVNRIVSGSYDGSIAIWTRGSDGRWLVAHRLNFRDTLLRMPSTYAPGDAVENETAGRGQVFKLLFDERRLICCGQGRRIVGWDFGLHQGPIIRC